MTARDEYIERLEIYSRDAAKEIERLKAEANADVQAGRSEAYKHGKRWAMRKCAEAVCGSCREHFPREGDGHRWVVGGLQHASGCQAINILRRYPEVFQGSGQ